MTSHAQVLIQNLESKVQDIYPIPHLLEKIMRALNDPESTVEMVERIFKLEPSLTLKLLTLANSAYFGLPGKITNIRSAITLLGLNMIKSLTIHASVNEFFRFGTHIPGFSGHELWKHSVGVAVAGKYLALRYSLGHPDDFFTLGILHDIGLILEYQFCRMSFINIISKMYAGNDKLPTLERNELGLDHAQLGRSMFAAWKLPAFYSETIAFHHDPLSAPESIQPQAIGLYLADLIVRKAGFGFGDLPETVPEDIWKKTGIPSSELDDSVPIFQKQITELTLFFE